MRIEIAHNNNNNTDNNSIIEIANNYNKAFENIKQLQIPSQLYNSSHVFHQYTLKVLNGKRDNLMKHLEKNGIETRVYYPIPVHKQKAFSKYSTNSLVVTEELSKSCISLPICTEIEKTTQDFIMDKVKCFFK